MKINNNKGNKYVSKKLFNKYQEATEAKISSLEAIILEINTKFTDYRKQAEENDKRKEEINDLIKLQPITDVLVVENSDAIKILKKEMLNLKKISLNKKDNLENKKNIDKNPINKLCRYFNRGFCKRGVGCNFLHPQSICQAFIDGQYCKWDSCTNRHPKTCYQYINNKSCVYNKKCVFYHPTNINNIEIGNMASQANLNISQPKLAGYEPESDSQTIIHSVQPDSVKPLYHNTLGLTRFSEDSESQESETQSQHTLLYSTMELNEMLLKYVDTDN